MIARVPGLVPITEHLVHIIRKPNGQRSFCGQVARHKLGGWQINPEFVHDAARWQRPGGSICVTCLQVWKRDPRHPQNQEHAATNDMGLPMPPMDEVDL